MKKIIINSKKYGTHYVLVDDEDFEWLNQWKWFYHKGRGNRESVERRIRKKDGKLIQVIMSRLIMGCVKGDGKIIDHKDRNPLNNQRLNLRFATLSQNATNKRAIGASKYLGVAKINRKSPFVKTYWYASIRTKDGLKYLGQFPLTDDGERLAAIAYNEAAIKHHGEFANLNIIT